VVLGNLVSPFAFLGPGYDKELAAIWTRRDNNELVVKQPLALLVGGSALADTQPLADLIAHYVNRCLLNAIAREYRKGRLLLIGTTNLDAQRPWSGTWARSRLALVPGLSAFQKSHVSIRLDPCRICAGADRGQCCRQSL
jgi:hypothetical protein